jgi:hypothetical protein
VLADPPISDKTPFQSATPLQVNAVNELASNLTATPGFFVANENEPNALKSNACSGVADRNPRPGQVGDRNCAQCRGPVDGKGAASSDRTLDCLVASRVRTLLPGGGEPAMVTDRLHCRKDDDEQVPTRPVSARWIMSQPAFALGAADARVGRGTHRDYDLWDTNGQWNAGEPGPRSHRGVSNCDVPGRSPQKPWPGSSPSAKTSSDNHH